MSIGAYPGETMRSAASGASWWATWPSESNLDSFSRPPSLTKG
jgi:hypothetical protein